MWAAARRRYDLIGEFTEEVLRKRFLVFAPGLGYRDFDAFNQEQALWHEELANLKDSALRKLRLACRASLSDGGNHYAPNSRLVRCHAAAAVFSGRRSAARVQARR